MTLPTQYQYESDVPAVTTRFRESAGEHVKEVLERGLDEDDPLVLTVGFCQDDAVDGSLELPLEIIETLRESGIQVTGYDTERASETIARPNDTPIDCYDAIVLFTPLHAIDDLEVSDLVSESRSGQLVVDLTGTVEPSSVVNEDAICITYRVL